MSFPVGIQGNHIRTVQFPFPTNRCRGIVILEVVCLDINTWMMTAGAIDTFPVDAPVSIELDLLRQLVCQSFGQLPVGMSVHGLITGVGDMILGLLYRLLSGVLPAVGVL